MAFFGGSWLVLDLAQRYMAESVESRMSGGSRGAALPIVNLDIFHGHVFFWSSNWPFDNGLLG